MRFLFTILILAVGFVFMGADSTNYGLLAGPMHLAGLLTALFSYALAGRLQRV